MTEARKVIISNRIYFKPDDLKEVIKSLTYRIESKSGQKGKFKNIEIIKNYKILPQDLVSVPQGRRDLIPPDSLVIDKRVTNPVPFPKPRHELRPGQQVIYDQVNDSCFINALVGWGRFCPTLK